MKIDRKPGAMQTKVTVAHDGDVRVKIAAEYQNTIHEAEIIKAAEEFASRFDNNPPKNTIRIKLYKLDDDTFKVGLNAIPRRTEEC